MNLKLAIIVILVLVATFGWTFVAPSFWRWRDREAARRRRLAEGRQK